RRRRPRLLRRARRGLPLRRGPQLDRRRRPRAGDRQLRDRRRQRARRPRTPPRTFRGAPTPGGGPRHAELLHVNIHSDDAAVLWLPAERILFAGDTLEDTVTDASGPDGTDNNLPGLQDLA